MFAEIARFEAEQSGQGGIGKPLTDNCKAPEHQSVLQLELKINQFTRDVNILKNYLNDGPHFLSDSLVDQMRARQLRVIQKIAAARGRAARIKPALCRQLELRFAKVAICAKGGLCCRKFGGFPLVSQ